MATKPDPLYIPSFQPSSRATMPHRIPQAAHRHATPSGPWPWSDIVEGDAPPFLLTHFGSKSESPTMTTSANANLWHEYPSSLFPNWSQPKVERSGIGAAIRARSTPKRPCVVYQIDVDNQGQFITDPAYEKVDIIPETYDHFWKTLQKDENPDSRCERRLRAIFVENMSGPALQMLGATYKIEPFFFSSSLNWIPSRYQEDVKKGSGDHVTLTLTFLRAMPNPMTAPNTPTSRNAFFNQMVAKGGSATIDTQAPLVLRSSDRILLIDLIALHMVRSQDGSTIISYHPGSEWKSTSARYLHSRVRYVGESVYWQSIFKQSSDPTFVLLSMVWFCLYAWDEALESLYLHISWMESRVLVTNDIQLTRELHIIRASLLHYTSLLENFRKAVWFIRNTPNPAMLDSPAWEESNVLMERECDTLISEIERLEMYRRMQEMRVENVMNLAFSSVNFEDSRTMKKMAEQSLRDGTAMKQISYLTMVFLPASFVSAVFGMNVQRFQDGAHGTIAQYLAVALPLTAVSIWIIIALHGETTKFELDDGDQRSESFVSRLVWPLRSLANVARSLRRKTRTKRYHVGGIV